MRAALVLLCCLSAPAWAFQVPDDESIIELEERSAGEVLDDLEALVIPRYDGSRRDEPGYADAHVAERALAYSERASLIRELSVVSPQHEQLPKLLPVRWQWLREQDGGDALALEEMNTLLARDALALEALYQKALLLLDGDDLLAARAGLDTFAAVFPGSDRVPRLLSSLASRLDRQGDASGAVAVYQELIERFPDSGSSKYAPGKVRQLTGLGAPFALSFTDAASGETVDVADWRGKVVVVDFWATWCGPCVADMPDMLALYEEFHPQGVEFVGISLDSSEEQGGLTKLLDYVATNEVPWPQYYQGAGWAGEFSVSWGINSIPALFVVGRDGNLASIKARGQLPTLLPELLGSAD